MNDLIFINNLEARQNYSSGHVTTFPASSSARSEGQARDAYVEGTNGSCSVQRLGANSRGGFWRLFFGLFGLD